MIDAGELGDERYRANPVDRCYYCKTNLYARIREATADPIASGTNRDDLADYRPGLRAAAERGVVHPYVDAGIDKAAIYALAARLGLDDLERLPAQPCLASRVETGIAIDAGRPRVHRRASRSRLAARSGREAVVRCRVTHAGVVIELGRRGDAAADAIARAIGARECRGERPRVRRRAPLRARRRVPDRDAAWLSSASTGSARSAPGRARRCCATRRPRRRSTRSSRTRRELGRRLLLTRLGERKFARLAAPARGRARLRRRVAHRDPRRRSRAARTGARRDRLRRHLGRAGRARSRAHARVRGRGGDAASSTSASPGSGG